MGDERVQFDLKKIASGAASKVELHERIDQLQPDDMFCFFRLSEGTDRYGVTGLVGPSHVPYLSKMGFAQIVKGVLESVFGGVEGME